MIAHLDFPIIRSPFAPTMPQPIDLRSDTVTRPTAAMRAAMAEAEVGDDVYGEDPTVNELEATAAEIFGKEAGLLLASGTQANAVATLVHTNPGQLAYCEVGAHVGIHEGGGYAALAGIALEKIPTPDGMLTADLVEERILPEDPHLAEPRLIWVENTHNGAGGLPTPKSAIDELGLLARSRGLSLHIDGARIFNAATALGCPVAELTAAADSVQVAVSVTDVDEPGTVSVTPSPPTVGDTLTATLIDTDGGVSDTTWTWTRVQSGASGQSYSVRYSK
ncbi:MAG: beta-eliminating lyase-related protein, partial [Chloroflexota bacterium]|nr:beta-eliminating lyase-related protein [Chloroflexota bacterium]